MNENLWSLNEYNQWLNVSITLLSIYTNNLDDANKSIIIWNNIENNLKYFNNNEYMDLIQILYRRAALYEPPTLAVITSYKSVIHFRKQDCKEELFLSLCNYGANLITTGQYKEALLNLHEANNIYEQENLSDLFSDDRLFLNIQIAKYMEREENILCLNKSFNKSEILNNVIATIDAITKYIETHDNIHCLYHVNLASLYAMLQMEEQYLYHINLVAQMSDKDDTFYSFYSDNIKLSYYILTNNYEKASELYKLLILNPYPTLFMNSDKHLHNRMDMINKIVNQEIECTNIEDFMNNMLAHCKNKIGNYSFFYRPFLLTDFQYLSQ
jgi:tetratricopeptide (TPR) repeat protein